MYNCSWYGELVVSSSCLHFIKNSRPAFFFLFGFPLFSFFLYNNNNKKREWTYPAAMATLCESYKLLLASFNHPGRRRRHIICFWYTRERSLLCVSSYSSRIELFDIYTHKVIGFLFLGGPSSSIDEYTTAAVSNCPNFPSRWCWERKHIGGQQG